ncbi:MAG: histidine phosphatase family protein [Planctomycetota bacterium]
MELFLVRHAIALPLGGSDGPPTDSERPLSPLGRERFASAVWALRVMGVRLKRVEHSPLLRAVQTAELLKPLLDGPMEVSPDLVSPPDAAMLTRLRTDGTALVGHEPWMSGLLAQLCGGSGYGVRFAKGAVAWLEGEPVPGGMQLRALWPAKTLALLRESSAP